MSNQRMSGDAIFADIQRANRELMARQQQIRSVMERQKARDIAATKGQIIPFSQADILRL